MSSSTLLVGLPLVGLLLIGACSSSTATSSGGGSSTFGAPCVPPSESKPNNAGASERQVGVEPDSAECGAGVCLLNHFRGRVSCPYGQDAMGNPLTGMTPRCTLPSTSTPVTAAVAAQCTDRTAATAVYCSCRCANVNGKTDDGATYCGCPQGSSCVQLAASLGTPGDTTSGGYCVKDGTPYDSASACSSTCDAQKRNCP